MRSIVIASSSQNMTSKLNRILFALSSDIYPCRTAAQLYSVCERLGGGVLVLSAMRGISVNDVKNVLPPSWDIVAILPSGVPAPFYSSNLTVLTVPVSAGELVSAVEMLMNVTDYKKTVYDAKKADVIEEAKRVLIKKNGISEDKAHYLLQKMSMNRGTTMQKTAQEIISESETSA